MKRAIYRLFLAVFIVLTTVNLFASDTSKTNTDIATGNLKNGINSENEGLKRSAVYFAGKYAVQGTCDDLLKLFVRENNPSTRILITQALYKINDALAMEKVYELIEKDSDPKVRRIGKAIYETYKLENYTAEEFFVEVH